MSSPSSTQQHEPTMEEILASIRKIISEDQAESAPAPTPVANTRPVIVASTPVVEEEPEEEDQEEPQQEAEILELTQEIEDVHEEPEQVAEPEMVVDDMVELTAADEVQNEPVEESPVHQEEPAMGGSEFISDNTRRAMSQAFQPFQAKPEPVAQQAAPGLAAVGGTHLESIFTQAIHQAITPAVQDWVAKNSGNMVQNMKPIIREWMDENLPPLIEKAVKSEIAAAVRTLTQRR